MWESVLPSGSGFRKPRAFAASVTLVLAVGGAIALASAAGSSNSGEPVFDEARAFSYLEAQCRFGPRVPGSVGHRRTLEYLCAFLEERRAQVIKQPFVVQAADSSINATNLIARFFPRITPRLLLCAHYDTRPWADSDPDTLKRMEPVPGANDGASGVAVLLEVANALASRTPQCAVDIALFDAEDMGGRHGLDYALGSSHYVSQLSEFPSAAILVDLVGYAELDLPVERYSSEMAPSLVAAVWGAASRIGLSQFRADPHKYVFDDHVPLLLAGIPAVNIVDIEYPYWHTVEDTPDKCSPASLDAVGTLLLHLLYHSDSPLPAELK